MAISATHYQLLRELKAAGELPQGGRILELGEANWYGDMDANEIKADITDTQLEQYKADNLREENLFNIAKLVYSAMFYAQHTESIDMDPEAVNAHKLDLNQPVDLGRQFDVTYNHGTAEHIFNIANVFRVMHDAVRPGGLMIHESPFTGWVDHGFYSLQPTLFYDVAEANGYRVVLMACEHLASRTYFKVECREHIAALKRQGQLADNLMLFVAFRKGVEESPFRVPMQGVYAGTVSEQGHQDWMELR